MLRMLILIINYAIPGTYRAYDKMLEFAKDISRSGMELRFTVVDLPIVDIEKCKKIADEYCADFKVGSYSGSV